MRNVHFLKRNAYLCIMESNSGIIIPQEAHVSEHFTDITPIPCKGYNLLCKARHYGRWWMLKGLKPDYQQQEIYKRLLRKEFDILISLQHPNIVSASSFEEIPGMGYCIVMEWIEGRTLGDFIKENTEEGNSVKEADEKSLLPIISQLLDTLQYIHAKQIVHRDLKPSNIMITYNGNHVKLIDFGLADTDSYAILKQPAGTQGFTSPEQASSNKADIRNDIYSLGCILEKMKLSKRYATLIARCKAPIQERYQHVEEIKHDLSLLSHPKAHAGKHLVKASLISILLILLVGGIGYTLLYNRGESVKKNEKKNEIEKVESRKSEKPELTRSEKTKRLTDQENKYSSGKVPVASTKAPTGESKIEEIIEKGKQKIDLMWKESGIVQQQHIGKKQDIKLEDLTQRSEKFYQFVEESNKFITDSYPNSYGQGLDAKGKTSIINTLSSYTTEKYVKTMLQELQKENEQFNNK